MPLLETIIEAVQTWQPQTTAHLRAAPTLAAREELASQLGQRVAQLALTHLLTEQVSEPQLRPLRCACGGGWQRHRRAARRVLTRVGEVSYQRTYYYCRSCGASRCPLDEHLQQSARTVSAGLERAVALLGAHLSFATSAAVLREVGGVELSGRQCETIAEAVGAEAEAATQTEAEQAASQDLAAAGRLAGSPAREPERVWVVEMDGVQVGLQDGTWQEVKCGVVYELGQRVQTSTGRWELLRRERCVLRGGVGQFRQRLWATLRRAGARLGERIVVLGDGAEWIDQTVAELFVSATRVLDFYHVAERVWAVAGVRYGEGSAAAHTWAQAKLRALKAGEVSEVCRAIKHLKLTESAAEQTRRETLRYLEPRRAQMAYAEYRADDLPIGSGAVEGSCKYLVTARCKQAGMRWTERGVEAVLALRCWLLNDRLDELRPQPKINLEWSRTA